VFLHTVTRSTFTKAVVEVYKLLSDQVIKLDALNPQVAARMVGAFNQWKRYDKIRQSLVRNELQRIVEVEGLSKDVYEIVSRNLKS